MQVTGRAFIKINGDQIRSQNGAKLMFGNDERAPVQDDSGTVGYSVKPGQAGIECTIVHAADTSLQALADITDATVMFETDTGKLYALRNAWLANGLALTANENGELPLVFNGLSAEEV